MKLMKRTFNVIKRAAKWYIQNASRTNAFLPSGMIPCRYDR